MVKTQVAPFLRKAFPDRSDFQILLDGEQLLRGAPAMVAFRECNIKLLPDWPKYSPDLNPQDWETQIYDLIWLPLVSQIGVVHRCPTPEELKIYAPGWLGTPWETIVEYRFGPPTGKCLACRRKLPGWEDR